MTDYTELKRLAEAFPADLDWDSNTEPFFNGPSGESLGGGATGFYSVYGKPFRLEGEDYDYDGPTYVEECPADFAKFMVAAREGVLALIAENEAARKELGNLRTDNAQLIYALKQQEQGYLVLRDERDQLKAENERLESEAVYAAAGFDAAREEVAQLKAENEELRMDVDRLQSATAFVQKLCGAAVKQPSVATGYLHDILSAMGKEEQS